MDFEHKRRQQFLGERAHDELARVLRESIVYFASNPYGSGRDKAERDMLGRMSAAGDWYRLLSLSYTAGEPIEPLRADLENAVVAYERYGELLWKYTGDRNNVVFPFTSLDDYCELMQLIGLCFLLHRRDLLPRLAALQDGLSAIGRRGEGNGGTDWLYEEFMAMGLGAATRFESEQLCCGKPYEALADAMSSENNADALNDLSLFLKRWYKDLAGTGWHDSHKPCDGGEQNGSYYGYWSFEAGAAVLLLGIEDDSSLHKYLYYPKDLVAWSRANASLSDPHDKTALTLRALAGEPCPRDGYWFTPARANSRRRFKAGEAMPDVGGDYGATIWQWDQVQ